MVVVGSRRYIDILNDLDCLDVALIPINLDDLMTTDNFIVHFPTSTTGAASCALCTRESWGFRIYKGMCRYITPQWRFISMLTKCNCAHAIRLYEIDQHVCSDVGERQMFNSLFADELTLSCSAGSHPDIEPSVQLNREPTCQQANVTASQRASDPVCQRVIDPTRPRGHSTARTG